MKRIYLNTLAPEEIISRLKKGEVVKSIDDEDFLCKLIDGFIVNKYEKEYSIGSSIIVDERNDFYFEEEEKFEVDCTGLYKTRDGRKVFVSCIDCDDEYPIAGIICGESEINGWTTGGNYYGDCRIYEKDLISKWEE